jgi:hypothetical protein
MKIYTEAATDVEYQVISIYNFSDNEELIEAMVPREYSLIQKEKYEKDYLYRYHYCYVRFRKHCVCRNQWDYVK